MPQLFSLTGQLRLIGLALIVMGLVHTVLPRVLGWPGDLRASSLLTRQVSYAHLVFIALTCALLGTLPLAFAPDLLTGAPLPTFLLCAQTLSGACAGSWSSLTSPRACGVATACAPADMSLSPCCGPG